MRYRGSDEAGNGRAEHGHEDGDGDGDGDGEGEPYMDGMSMGGVHLEASLTADPAPPAKGGLTLEVTPFMPAHGHGAVEVTVSDDGGGTYTAYGVDLFMAGVWDTTVHISDAEHEGVFHFVFDIEESNATDTRA